jgi:glyoxylase-like metal-dependent hydrolase (beta-lactamase superfamily II)
MPGGGRLVRNQARGGRVYAAIAKPMYRVNSNTVIILLGDGVLVVDANSTPSAARSLIEQIGKLTPKPVKYVVNTHFHWDHSGNEAYLSSWPAGVEIISSQATRETLEQRDIPRWKHEIAAMPQEIDQLKSDLQKTLSAEQLRSYDRQRNVMSHARGRFIGQEVTG